MKIPDEFKTRDELEAELEACRSKMRRIASHPSPRKELITEAENCVIRARDLRLLLNNLIPF